MSSTTVPPTTGTPSAWGDVGYSTGDQSAGMGCSEIISLIGVIIACVLGIAGLINWKYKRRGIQRHNQTDDQEAAVEVADLRDTNGPVSPETTPHGYTIVMWTIPPRGLTVPAPAVTSSGRVVEMGDLEEGRQGGASAGSRDFILPGRLQGVSGGP